MPFPLSPVPAAFVNNVNGTTRGNVFLEGETVTFTFNKAFTGTWTVRDYYGNVITTGALVAANGISPTPPVGGWPRGWYRLYLTGAVNDAVFGFSLGVSNFAIIANDPRFTPRPARSDDPFVTNFQGEDPDLPLKGFLGIGTSRLVLSNAAAPTVGTGGFTDNLNSVTQGINQSHEYWTTGAAHTGPDPARPRLCYVTFMDAVDHQNIINGNEKLIVSFKNGTAAAAGNVSIVTAAGTSSGIKLTFTQGATVETYDNVTATITGVLQRLAAVPSNLVCVYRADSRGDGDAVVAGVNVTLTNAKYLGVKQVVETCYPLGVEWYEGPYNEPDLRQNPVRYAHDAEMFRDAVKAGNPAAKVMGPSVVSVTPGPGELPTGQCNGAGAIYRWLLGGIPANGTEAGQVENVDGPNRAAKNYIDGMMIHVYNFMLTDINSGRWELDNFVRILQLAGVDHLPRFQGELGVMTPVYGVYHPRRGRWQMLFHLMLDQYGIPKERNNLWYDRSHGFWDFPVWWINADQSLNPHGLLVRVMAEELYGKTFETAVDFGTGVGNRMFLGNLYVNPTDDTSVLGLVAASNLEDATIVLQLTGNLPATVTWRDGFGVQDTASVDTEGRVTLPISGEPTWVRLPAGVTAIVHTFLDLHDKNVPNLAGRAAWATNDGSTSQRKAVNNKWQETYDDTTKDVAYFAAPANLSILLERHTTISHVMVFAGMMWQSQSTLVDFDVQTSVNGLAGPWTTRATVTKTPGPSSFLHGSDVNDTGTQRETFYDEQWIFPVELAAPVSCNAIRLVVRQTTYGGEPDSAVDTANQGQGNPNQFVTLTEVYVIGDPPARWAATV